MNKSNIRGGLLNRVQRRMDNNYKKKCEEWAKINSVPNEEKNIRKIELGKRIDDSPPKIKLIVFLIVGFLLIASLLFIVNQKLKENEIKLEKIINAPKLSFEEGWVANNRFLDTICMVYHTNCNERVDVDKLWQHSNN